MFIISQKATKRSEKKKSFMQINSLTKIERLKAKTEDHN